MMTGTIRDLSSVAAPEGFALRVQTAARSAVRTSSRRRIHLRTVLIAAILLLVSLSAAAGVINWAINQFFSQETGFRIPGYEWGSPASSSYEQTMTVHGMTGEVFFQYENDALLSVTITFNRQNQPEEDIQNMSLENFYEKLRTDMCAAYGNVSAENTLTQEQRTALKNALREYYSNPMANDRTRAGGETDVSAPAAPAREYSNLVWVDEKTNTAIELSAAYTEDLDRIRSVKITLTEFR